MKKVIKKIVPLFIILISNMTSCSLGLDDLPSFTESEIIKFEFERRYVEEVYVTVTVGGQTTTIKEERVKFEGNQTTSVNINKQTNEIHVVFKANAPIDRIVGLATISPGATIVSLDGAPALGKLGNFVGTKKYLVTSADKKNSTQWAVISTIEP